MTNINQTVNECMKDSILWEVVDYYIFNTITVLGIVFNLICTLIFIKIIKNEKRGDKIRTMLENCGDGLWKAETNG